MEKFNIVFFLSMILCLIFTHVGLTAQTYLTPYIGMSLNTISNSELESRSLSFYELENNVEKSHFIGTYIQQSLSNDFNIQLGFEFDRLEVKTGSKRNTLEVNGLPFDSQEFKMESFIHHRYGFSLGIQFEILSNFSISYSHRLLHTPKTIWHNREFMDDNIVHTKLFELAHRLELSYLINNLFFSAQYTYGYKKINNAFAEIDPAQSIGFKVGYRFKILDKLNRNKRSKVVCPKV